MLDQEQQQQPRPTPQQAVDQHHTALGKVTSFLFGRELDPATGAFHYRGIEFRFDDFAAFYAAVGDKPSPDHWLVRIDRDGHIEAGNLHWIAIKRDRKRKCKRRFR